MHDLTPTPGQPGDEPAASAADSQSHRSGPRTRSQHKARGKILNQEECLAGLSQLPGLLAIGFVTPAQASAIRSVYAAILAHYKTTREPANGAAASEAILTAIRNDPALLNLLGPLLSDEQFDAIVGEVTRGGHDKT